MSNNRVHDLAADQKMADGCNKRLLALASVIVGGQPLKPADILARLQTRISALQALEAAEAAFHKAVQDNKDVRAQSRPFMTDLRAAIRVLFGTDIVALADFGLEAPKPRVKKPATLVAAAAKAKATRQLRGTKGSRQRKAVQAPATEPAAPAPAPATTPTPGK